MSCGGRRLIVWLAVNHRKPCSPETNSNCDARQRLPLGVIVELVHQTARKIEAGASDEWLWKGREISRVDIELQRNPSNDECFPGRAATGGTKRTGPPGEGDAQSNRATRRRRPPRPRRTARKSADRNRDCSIATGADSKIARQEQGESTWNPLNASELAPNSANGLIPSLIAWAKSQPPGNVAIVSTNSQRQQSGSKGGQGRLCSMPAPCSRRKPSR